MEHDQIAPEAGEVAPVEPASVGNKRRSRRRSITIFVVVSLLNVGLLALLWTQLLTPTSKPSDPLVGHPAPDFTLSLLSANGASNLSLASLKGKPVVLNMWTSTCVPCIAEAPLLQQQWTQAKSQGVVFLGVDYQDVPSDGLHFLSQYNVTYPNVLDATGSVAINYGVTGTPETFFINRQGIVVAHVIGELTPKVLQQNLQLIMHS